MVTKHFFKVLTIFASMIMLGLVVLLATGYLGEKAKVQATDANNKTSIAK